MADAATEDSVEQEADAPATNEAALARKWRAEISAAEKAQAKWVERGKKIEKIYADERDLRSDRSRKFNILWSNVETLRPAVYMQTPKPQAQRRYRDRDPVARLASMLLERGLQTSCEMYDFDDTMDQAARDRLLPGRGQVWVSYAPEITNDVLTYEMVLASYVPWQDFLHSVARTWEEVRWVARRFYKSRRELVGWLVEAELAPDKKAAKIKAASLQMDYGAENEKTDEGLKDERAKCQIWEVHSKEDGQVLYIAPGSNDHAVIGVKPPAVKFRDFFPCPRPLLATTTAKSLIPTPDYALYQDQAEELNRVTERIGVLQKALKVVGVYASESAELAQMIEATDNQMIPVKDWAMFAEGGGAKNRIEWFPVDVVAEVLKGLYEIREQAKQTLYEVSGIGDILRGATDPDETATAQGIKAKWGSLRVRRIQKDVQRFAKDIMRLKAEVIAEQFSERTILQMAGVDQELLAKYVPPPPPQEQPQPQPGQMPQQGMDPRVAQIQAKAQHDAAIAQFLKRVFALLKDDTARSFRIDVETDSTLEPDLQEEKQVAVEFMTAMTAFMKEAAPMAAQGPEAAKLVGEILLFGVRRFDKVDELEQVIEQAVEAAAKPRPPQPDPEMMKAQADIKAKEAGLMIDARKADKEIEHKERMADVELKTKVVTAQADMAIKQQEATQRAQEGEQALQLSAAQGQQALKQGEQKMTIADRAAKAKLAMQEGSPPE